ncbi:MAG: tetratricopeptide repeat protein [Pyrinomonadaceae bacterium]
MIRNALFITALFVSTGVVYAQTPARPTPSPSMPQRRSSAPFELSEYGVQIQAEPRLIIVMAALDAAGFDPTPPGREASAFRRLVRRDQESLDPDLRARLKTFYERNKLPAPATPADQAARYVSLAYAIGPPPLLEAPERSDELPGGVLAVLDFAPLVREFYRKSGIDERLVAYSRAYQAEGERLRPQSAQMVRSVLSYLHTRPIVVSTERVRVKSPDKKNSSAIVYSTRQHDRHFYIVPDLLAAPGTVNFRVIADEYYAIVPEGTDPTTSELRHAFMQFVIDPLVLKFNKEISAQRDQIKQLIDARTKAGATVSPDIFVVVARSLVAAADARFDEAARLNEVMILQRRRLQQARDEVARKDIATHAGAARAAIADETIARLADDYENGAVLDFLFADQLRDLQASGFDIGNLFAEMISGVDPARESNRLSQAALARDRALAARKAHPRYSSWLIDATSEPAVADASSTTAFVKKMSEVERLLQTRNYEQAETRLKSMLQDNPGDARLFFTLGQTASLWARDTTDDDQQTQRLNRALRNYRLAVAAASAETDQGLLSRAHESMGRILAFLEQKDEAMKEFDAAIKIGPVAGGAYYDALAGKRKLAQP